MKQPEKLLSADEVKATLAPHMKAVWDAAAKCLDTPTDENLSEFKKLCRPAEIMVLLRHYAESVVSETNAREMGGNKMNERPTPETDAESCYPDSNLGECVCADFARKLERERDEAREAFVIATDQVVLAQSKLRETDKERQAFVIAQQEVITNLILERNKALDKVINDLKNILR